jgi:hypothetical protein
MRKLNRLALAALTLLAAAPVAGHAADPQWTCDGDYRLLGTTNGPGAYRFRPTSGMTFRFISQTNGTFSVSERTGTTCSIKCLHTNLQQGAVRECVMPAVAELVLTVANGDAIATSDNPAGQPGSGVPLPGPLPNDPLLADPGCDDCAEILVRAMDTIPSDARGVIVVRGEHAGDRYVVTIRADGEDLVPPISVEDQEALPSFELPLLPEATPVEFDVIARYHPNEQRCPVAVGDPGACGPAGPLRAPRDDSRWREAGLIIRVLPDGPELFVPYVGQLCAGHQAPGGPNATPC